MKATHPGHLELQNALDQSNMTFLQIRKGPDDGIRLLSHPNEKEPPTQIVSDMPTGNLGKMDGVWHFHPTDEPAIAYTPHNPLIRYGNVYGEPEINTDFLNRTGRACEAADEGITADSVLAVERAIKGTGPRVTRDVYKKHVPKHVSRTGQPKEIWASPY